MTDQVDGVQLLPPGTGSKPWLPAEAVEVPVWAAGSYKNVIGKAWVYAGHDESLMADVTFSEGVSMTDYDPLLQFGVDGQVVEEHTRDGVRVIDRVQLLGVAIAAVARLKR